MEELKITKKSSSIANISNQLAFNLSWDLNHREWNVVLYLISKIDSKNQVSFEEQLVPIKDLEKALKEEGKKWGGLYSEIEKLRKGIMRKPIDFYTDVLIDGKPLMGGISFFEMIIPERLPDGTVCLRFKFTSVVKPLLLELSRRFVSIPQDKTKLIKSGYAIRFLILAKAERDSKRSFQAVSSLRYSIEDFKVLFGIADKKSYKDLRNLKRVVIKKIEKEMNENCDFLEIIDIIYHPVNGKPKTEIEFLIADKNDDIPKQLPLLKNIDSQPSKADINSLSRSKLTAYHTLVEFGVTLGISYWQILPKAASSSEFVGFEDWYIEELLVVFNQKTKKRSSDKKGRVGAFVKWILGTGFTKHQFSEVMERILARKKTLQKNHISAWENRLFAQKMTASEFENWHAQQKKKAESLDTNANIKKRNTIKHKLKTGTGFSIERWIEENPDMYKTISTEQRKEVEQSLKDLGDIDIKNKEEMINNRIESVIKKIHEKN